MHKIIIFFVFMLLPILAQAEVKLLQPANGDTLIVGNEITIRWANNSSNSVSLYYSNDGGVNWKVLADGIITNEFVWKIPYLSNKGLMFKVEENIIAELFRRWVNPLAHSKEIRNCEFSADGKYFLTAGDDSYFRIWDIDNQKIHTEFLHSQDTLYPVLCAQFWGGIDTVIYCWRNSVWLWNRQDNSAEKLFDLHYTTYFVSTDYASGNVAACSHSVGDTAKKTIFIYSIKEKQILKQFNNPKVPADDYYRCRYSPSGNYLAFVGYNKVVNVYDVLEDTLRNFVVQGGTMAIMGVDFSFDESEVIVCGLDGIIRRFSLPNVESIGYYVNVTSTHSRSIRYVSPENDFICGGVGSHNLVYGNLSRKKIDSVEIGYQITDVNFYGDKYYLVAGREPTKAGKFTLFESYLPPIPRDTVICNVFYKFNASISNKKASYGEIVTFNVNFSHKYEVDSIPFSEISAYALVGLPYKMFDFSVMPADPYYPPTSTDTKIVYAVRVDNVLPQHTNYSLRGRTLLTSQKKAPVYFETCYSSNEMILYNVENGELEILSECSEDNGRFIVSADATSLKIEEISSDKKIIVKLNIGDDDGHSLIISNIAGNILFYRDFDRAGTYNIAFGADELSAGVYLIQLASKSNTITDKIILAR